MMGKSLRAVVGLSTALCLAGASYAAADVVLATTPVELNGRALDCLIANVSNSRTVQVTIDLSYNSAPGGGIGPFTLAPGASNRGGFAPGGVGLANCKFTISGGGKRDVRAGYCLGATSGSCEVIGPAAE